MCSTPSDIARAVLWCHLTESGNMPLSLCSENPLIYLSPYSVVSMLLVCRQSFELHKRRVSYIPFYIILCYYDFKSRFRLYW